MVINFLQKRAHIKSIKKRSQKTNNEKCYMFKISNVIVHDNLLSVENCKNHAKLSTGSKFQPLLFKYKISISTERLEL